MAGEHDDIMFSWAHFYWTLNQRRSSESRMRVNTEIFQQLAAMFGFDDAQFRHPDREMIEHYVDGKAARMQGITMETFSTRDYARLDEGTPHDRVPYKNGNYPTPPGKCEFVKQSRAVNRSTYRRVTWRRKRLRKRTQKLAQRFPLNIVLPRSHGFVNLCYANEVQKIEGQGE